MEKTATEIVIAEFEKVAKFKTGTKSTTGKGELPNYRKVLKKNGVKDQLGGAMKNGKRFIRKEKVKNFAKSNKKALAIGASASALAGMGAAGYKAYKSHQKTAFDIINDSFEKQAGVLAGVKAGIKGLAGATASLGKNAKNFKQGSQILRDASKVNHAPMMEHGKNIMKNNAKQIGKGLVLPGAGVGTVGLAGVGAKSLMSGNKEVTASDVVSFVFEKEAKLNFRPSKASKLKEIITGKNISDANSKIRVAKKALTTRETMKRLKGEKKKEIAKTVGAYGAGLTGIAGAGVGTAKAMKKEK